jgi:hypothetical protein
MLCRPAAGDLEPSDPTAVIFTASAKAIDAFPGAKCGPPGVVTNETKFACTDCASRNFAGSMALGHRGLLMAIVGSSTSSSSRSNSSAHNLRRPTSAAQLNPGRRPASKRVTNDTKAYDAPPKADRSRMGRFGQRRKSIPESPSSPCWPGMFARAVWCKRPKPVAP